MNAYYKGTEKPFGYLLVDNKPSTPPDNQILADLFGECYVYDFGVKSPVKTKPKTHFAKKVNGTTTKTTSSRKLQTVTWSNVSIPEWQKYTSGAPEFRARFRKDMLSSKCTTHRAIKVISLNVEVC